jgi:hypothetical protein
VTVISLISADFKFSFFKTSKPQYKKSGRGTPLAECCLMRAIDVFAPKKYNACRKLEIKQK